MSREYLFDKKTFMIRVVYAGILALIVLIFGMHSIIMGSSITSFWILICFLCVYTIMTNFISISYPRKIVIDDDKISFSAFNKSHVYSRKELESFKVKERQLSKKLYIRVNKPSLIKGRYWIDLSAYNDYEELRKTILEIEEAVHPDSLKAKIKKNNAMYEERKKKNVSKRKGRSH